MVAGQKRLLNLSAQFLLEFDFAQHGAILYVIADCECSALLQLRDPTVSSQGPRK